MVSKAATAIQKLTVERSGRSNSIILPEKIVCQGASFTFSE